eukprot:Phypoly_transcript_16106.p1 GENE.Phypoly_transcript_16106~~Phypoly_transcript_16106.p1  ORF type:complete len:184 (+),score=37.05 Phypoly_transcript_16106:277-828(+)
MAWKQRWSDYFDLLDGDKNGFIDANDIPYMAKGMAKMIGLPENAPEVKGMSDFFGKFFNSLIKEFDANSDGKVSRAELLAGVEKKFIGKESSPAWWNDYIDATVKFLMAGKAELSFEEVLEFVKRFDPSVNPEALKKSFEWSLTLNKNGKFDGTTWGSVLFVWATSPDDTPQAKPLLPLLYKH